MTEGRKVAAILVADIVGYSRLTGADEERTLARLRTLRSDLIDPAVAVHDGRIVKRTGDGAVVEFRSVVEAVRAAIDVQGGLAERNAGVSADKRIEVRVGIHLGDVVEEADGDLMGDGVNVAARLQAICEPGGICLSEDAYRQVRDKLQVTFADLGEQSLKNIARPVRAYALKIGGAASGAPAAVRTKSRARAARWTLAAALAAVLIAAGWLGWQRIAPPPASAPPPAAAVADDKLARAPRLSLVVLPFANLSGDPEEDRFGDALTDDLTTALSRTPESFVVSRSTASAYKGKPVDLKQLGRELGVRYALEGGLRREGDAITINAQLIATEAGAHIWADRFEGERGKLDQLQFEAQARIANGVARQLIETENQRALRERPTKPEAADLALRGWAAVNAGFTPENFDRASDDFEEALRLDPDNNTWALNGSAYAEVSRLLAFQIGLGQFYEILADAEAKVDRVLAAEPNSAQAHFTKGLIAFGNGDPEAWLAETNAAIAADRNKADSYVEKARYLIAHGRSDEGIALIDLAMRLDPENPSRGVWEYQVCHAYAYAAEWEKVVDVCHESAAMSPALAWPYFDLVAAYGWLGRQREARDAIVELRQRRPTASVEYYRMLQGTPDPKFASELNRVLEGLRKAGLPEH